MNHPKRCKKAKKPVHRPDDAPNSLPLSHPAKERFCQLRATGCVIAHAAAGCDISEASAYRWLKDTQVRARIAQLQFEDIKRRENIVDYPQRRITFSRNDVVMELWEIGHYGENERARVSALSTLADIFLWRAKNITDLIMLKGWTDEELQYLADTGYVPPRIADLTGARTAEDLVPAVEPPGKKR